MPYAVDPPADPFAPFRQQWLDRGNSGSNADMFDQVFTSSILPGTFTVDTLPAPSAENLGKYAVVSDLYGDKTDKVLCSKSGALFYWQPLRTQYDRSLGAGSDQTVQLLKQGTVFSLSGSIGIGVTRTVTMSTAFAWPGAQAEFKFPGTILGALNILGTGLGSAVSLLGGGYRKFSCELISGSLAWKQLV